MTSSADWWFGAKKRIYLDFHMPEHGSQAPVGLPLAYQALDPSGLALAAAQAGADVLVFYARDNQGNSYYPTSIGHQLGDLNGRDVVQEFLDALRLYNLRAVAYFQPIRDRRRWEDHPEWRQINSDGTEKVPQSWLQQGKGGHRLICPLGGAADQIFAELEELVTRYQLDGVWWDRVGDVFGPDSGFPCFCAECQSSFLEAVGLEIPRNPDWDSKPWRTYYRWRADRLLEFQKRAHGIMQERGQGACLISNYAFHGMAMADPVPLSVDWESIADATDVAALEVQHMRSYLHISSHPMLMDALTEKPIEMIMWNNGHIGDGFVRSFGGTEVAAFASFVRGHAVTLHDTVDHSGRADPRLFEMASNIFDRLQYVAEDVAASDQLHHTGVLFSPQTYAWFGKGQPDSYVHEFMGTLRQALGLHTPLEVISDRHLNDQWLSRFAMIVLPMSACISDAAVQALVQWVSAGGVVLGSHAVGIQSTAGSDSSSPALRQLFGVRSLEMSNEDEGWMRARPKGYLDESWGEYPVAFRSTYLRVEPLSGTDVVADIGHPLSGLDTFVHFIAPADQWGPYPAVTHRAVGKGHAILCTPALGSVDLQYGVRELREPMNLAFSLAGSPSVRAVAPMSVELIARSEPGRRILVFLANLQGEVGRTHFMRGMPARTKGVDEVLPVVDLKLITTCSLRSARELYTDESLRIEVLGNETHVILPRLLTTAAVELVL